MKNKRNLIISICFFLGAIFSAIVLFQDGFSTYLISGIILFTLVGFGFFKRRNDS